MNKFITVILIVLLVATIGCGAYFYQKNVKTTKMLQDKTTALENSIKEKTALQQKVVKVLNYAKAVDLLLDTVRKDMGLSKKYNYSDVELLSQISNVVKTTNDTELNKYFAEIQEGGPTGQNAFIGFLVLSISTIVDSLK